MNKSDLDKRICDVESNATNTETYREFIERSESEFELEHLDLDIMLENELNDYFNFLDYLWDK